MTKANLGVASDTGSTRVSLGERRSEDEHYAAIVEIGIWP
jgi:hypothetical protein